jgi:hypothetical protein
VPDAPRERAPTLLALGGALVLAYLAVRPHLYVSWTPGDEGVLAQGAERVMRGEVPHRDFVALWSGGLDYLNAAAFRLLGTRLTTLRTVVLGAWLLGLSAMFASARRMLPVWGAVCLTVCAAVWTLPLSPHPLPSWYTLFLSLFGVAAIVQWMHRRSAIWLAAAGVAAGAAVAVKITGLYFIAGVLLWVVWQVQDDVPAPAGGRPSAARGYAWTVTLCLAAYLALVTQLVRSELSANTALHFIAPNALLAGVLLWREWRLPARTEKARFVALASLAGPFALGVAIALVPWLWPYGHTHALGDLARGLFVTPRLRLAIATYPLPGLRSAGVSVAPFFVLLAGAPFVRQPLRRVDVIGLAAVFGAAFAFSYDGSPVVLVTWYGLRMMAPVCAVLTAWWIVAPPRGVRIPRESAALVFLLVAAAVTASFVQIPFALYTYFLYFVPLLALALAALLTAQPVMPRAVPAALLAFVLLFGARNPDSLPPRHTERAGDALAPLALARGGIIVTRDDSALYAQLIGSIQRHAAGGWMYVWHDAPQLYFLAGLHNPTHTMFDAFDDSIAASAATLTAELESRDVRVVVLTDPEHAIRPIDPAFHAWLLATYPESEPIQRFEVRWRREPLNLKP